MLNIYKASAGSGKTYTLALEYIKMVLGIHDPETGKYRLNKNPRDIHRHILAITFTVKATEEMKQRIIHEIALLAGREPRWKKPSNYTSELCDLFGCSVNELSKAANVALDAILYDYSLFTISTIDAFFQTVLRTFAREAELTGNYEIELNDTAAITYGVNQMFASLNETSAPQQNGENPEQANHKRRQLYDWILKYITNQINEGKSFNILNRDSKGHGDMIKLIQDVSGEEFKLNFDSMMEYLKEPERISRFTSALYQKRQLYINSIRQHFSALKNYIDSDDGLYYIVKDSSSTIQNNAWSHLEKYASCQPPIKLGETEKNIANDSKNFFSSHGKKTAYVNDSKLNQLIADAYKTLVNGLEEYEFISAISPNLFILGLLERVYDNIRRFSNENNIILLSDTASLLRKIIGDDEIPFVYERIGQEFQHFLIDEFQDTSELQWRNILPLINESLANDNDNLIIGDIKQCIYRFRDSDPSLLRDINKSFPYHANPIKNNLDGNTNRRSADEIVQFNNTIFLNLGQLMEFTDIYNSVVQPVPNRDEEKHGFVKAVVIQKATKEEYNSEVLCRLLNDINVALDHGYPPGDIAILVRTRNEGESVINHIITNRENLHYQNLRVISDDSMGLAGAPVVRMIISILGYLAETAEKDTNPNKEETAAQRIARLVNHYEHLRADYNDETLALNEALRMVEVFKNSDSEIDRDVADIIDMTCLSLPSIVERIVTKYLKDNQDETRNSASIYIAAFQDVVLDYSERYGSDLRAFLKWWETNGCKTTIAGAPDPNAIRVMTIHKAKGLEFRVVIVPFVNKKVPDFKSPEWFALDDISFIDEKDIIPPMVPITPTSKLADIPALSKRYKDLVAEQKLDELNVVYVAFTRATDAMNIYLGASGDSNIGTYVRKAICESTPDMVRQWIDNNEEARRYTTDLLRPIANYKQEEEWKTKLSDENDDNPKKTLAIEAYTIGEFPTYHKKQETNHTAVEPHEVIAMPPYESRNREDIWKGSRIDSTTVSTPAIERGKAIHAILSRVRHTSDLDKAIRDAVHTGLISEGESLEISEYLSRRLSNEDVNRWFEGYSRLLIERAIANTPGKYSHRIPDRVVWTANGTIDLIDYKTGNKTDSNTQKYSAQVKNYIGYMNQIGFDNINGYLWYLDEDIIVPVK